MKGLRVRKKIPEAVLMALRATKAPTEPELGAAAFSERKNEKTSEPTAVSNTTEKKAPSRKAGGARHIAHYHDQHEDYIPVSRSLLRELSSFGWLQEGAGAAGMFFFSGAFWLLITLLAEHSSELDQFAAWIAFCGISILFGGVLIWIGYRHFFSKTTENSRRLSSRSGFG